MELLVFLDRVFYIEIYRETINNGTSFGVILLSFEIETKLSEDFLSYCWHDFRNFLKILEKIGLNKLNTFSGPSSGYSLPLKPLQ